MLVYQSPSLFLVGCTINGDSLAVDICVANPENPPLALATVYGLNDDRPIVLQISQDLPVVSYNALLKISS